MRERPFLILFLLTLVAIGALYAADIRFPIGLDQAIARELRLSASTADLNAHIADALAKDDIDTANMYAAIAQDMGRELSPDVQKNLAAANSPAAVGLRTVKNFAGGFWTGTGTTNAGLAGALTSDVTVVGDVRDISSEGQKMVAGQDYSKLVLGLSVVGLAATVATIATGGGGIIAKTGVSILKAAERAGTLTADFARALTRIMERTVDFREVGRIAKTTNLSDVRATEDAFSAYARTVKKSEIVPVLGKLGKIGEDAGPAETVRLMRYVHSERDLDDVAEMSGKFGKKTRGVIELTGKTALRAFKTSLNIFEFLVENIIAFGAWLLGLLSLAAGRQAWRIVRH